MDFELQALRMVNERAAYLDPLLGFGNRAPLRERIEFHLRLGTEMRESDWQEAERDARAYAKEKGRRLTETAYAISLGALWEDRRARQVLPTLPPTPSKSSDHPRVLSRGEQRFAEGMAAMRAAADRKAQSDG